MNQPFCLTYSYKIWPQQVCFLNAHKTVTLTNKTQPLSQFVLSNGQVIQMECGEYGHRRWLGCILGVGRFHRTSLDAEFHLQAACRAFFADSTCDRSLAIFRCCGDTTCVYQQSINVVCKPWIVISETVSEDGASSCFC